VTTIQNKRKYDDDVIDRVLGKFRKQSLSFVVATDGGHTEHRFE